MLKTLIRAFFVLRLASRQPALNVGTVLAYWRARPAIHYIVGQAQMRPRPHAFKRILDEVYPF
jgi:hypothetical protein